MRLREQIETARKKGVAIGHLNFSNLETLWGIFKAARQVGVPIIVGTSEGERNFVGVKQAVALVRSLREEYSFPIFLNADHSYSFEKVKEAVDAGFDAVIFDGTKLPFEENVRMTRQCVEYARKVNPEIIVEGEIGFIGGSSKVLESVPEGVELDTLSLTNPNEARRYVRETGVDLFAPAVGNIHGMLRSGKEPALNIDRIKEIAEAVKIPLVLHGASGNTDDELRLAIKAGVRIVHVNTELRVAYRKGLQMALQEDPDEIAPYKFLKRAAADVQAVAEEKLRLFSLFP